MEKNKITGAWAVSRPDGDGIWNDSDTGLLIFKTKKQAKINCDELKELEEEFRIVRVSITIEE